MIWCMQHRAGNVQQTLTPPNDLSTPPIVLGIGDREDQGESADRRGFFGHDNGFIAIDGRVSNVRALRHRLASDGIWFETACDSEVILRAIGSLGPHAIGQFEGCFALAHFDRITNSLLLARDKMGGKPLYYSEGPGLFAFASEVRAILAAGVVSQEIDIVGLATCLAYGSLIGSRTLHSAIKSLPAATYRIIKTRPSGIELQEAVRYWSPPAITSSQRLGQDALLSIHSSLEKVLSVRTAADHHRCVLLSDGLASAYLAATSNAFVPGIASFTIGVDSVTETRAIKDSDSAFAFGHYKRELVTDALRDASASAIAIGLNHHQVVTDSEWVKAQIPEWLRFMDQPTVGGLGMSILINAAMERGFREQISGLGAAEILGYSRAFAVVPQVVTMLNRTRWLPQRWRENKVPGLLNMNQDDLLDLGFLRSDGTPFQRAMRLHRVFGNESLASLGLSPQQLGQDVDLFGEEFRAADAASGDDVLQGIMRAESSWALVKRRELTSLGDACGADVLTPFLEPSYHEAISQLSCETFAALARKHGSLLQGLATTTLPLEIARRPRGESSLLLHAWRYYSLSAECGRHVQALITSGIASPAALTRLWDEARVRSNPRQALIMAAVGFYLAQLPTTIAGAQQAAG